MKIMNILFLLARYLESEIRKIFMTLHKKANVLVSADQFEKLRNKSNYKLFSIRFFSLFIHSWLKSGYDAHVYSPKFKSNFRQ